MDIARTKVGHVLLIKLTGRLDAAWAADVERTVGEAVRAGEHHIHLDMAEVRYVSSVGLRVLMASYKLIAGIHGEFLVCHPSAEVKSVLELSGLSRHFLQEPAPQQVEVCEAFSSDSAAWQAMSLPVGEAMRWRGLGATTPWGVAAAEDVLFPKMALGLGIGSFGSCAGDSAAQAGEFLAIAGCAVHLPPGGTSRPDFLIEEEAFVPSLCVKSGLAGQGVFSDFLRFEASTELRSIGFQEICETCLQRVSGSACVLAFVAETTGLVGAALRRAPEDSPAAPFAFPRIRDHLLYTPERAFRGSTSLVVAFVAERGSAWDAWLRPLTPSLLVHAHAVAAPYRPLRKGLLDLVETVHSLFDAQNLQGILHLINDQRIPSGAGQSEFTSGACWVAPVEL